MKTPQLRYRLPVYLFSSFFLILTLALTSRVYSQRISVFGCFDQCFNYVAAFFMLKGKTLYSQIFFNHQPLMAYLSYGIQAVLQPKTLYELVLYHRRFIIFFSLLMNFLIIFRFRWVGAGFVLFYETTKYYLFGSFFLPEAVITFPLVYLLGLAWEGFQKKQPSSLDLLISGVFAWFVIFTRTPFIPVALFLYASILLQKGKNKKLKYLSLVIFLFLYFFTLLSLPLRDYFFEVFIVNLQTTIPSEAKTMEINGIGILKAFLYPFLIIFGKGKWNYFRFILAGLDLVFLASAVFLVARLKKIKPTLLMMVVLGLSAIRLVEPGTIFYEAFHMLPWHALFIMTIFLFLHQVYLSKQDKQLFFILFLVLIVVFAYTTISRQSFIWEKANREEEWTTNYAHYFVYGEAIKQLAEPGDTLFLERWDDLIYWQSGLDSSYQYSLYTPVMTNFPKYNNARTKMFQEKPPDFYYAFPLNESSYSSQLPQDIRNDYLQLYQNNEPTPLYLRKTKLPEITEEQWKKARKLGFYLPK